jgi:hypothetical protein
MKGRGFRMIRNFEKPEEYDAGMEPVLVSFGELFFQKRKGRTEGAKNRNVVKISV